MKRKYPRLSKCRALLSRRDGMTLVNVLVSFVVLLLLVLMFTRVMVLSQNLIVKADEAALAIEFYRRMKETDRMNRHLSKQEREKIRATRDADLAQLSALKRREFHIEPSTVALTSAL